MQKLTQKYVIVSLMRPLSVGHEYYMTDWPLHITLADVFSIKGSPKDLLESLRQLAKTGEAVQISVTADEWFGQDRSVHVRLLEKTPQLQQLHETILDVLAHYSAIFNNPEYTKTGFRPHSTIQKNEELKVGDTVTLSSLTLIDMFPERDPSKRRVLGTISMDD